MALEDPTEEMRDKGAARRELMSKTAEAWKNEKEMLCFVLWITEFEIFL